MVNLQPLQQWYTYLLLHYFSNFRALCLGKDALLVAPCPRQKGNPDIYKHLASFMKSGLDAQILQFWKKVAIDFIQEVHRRNLQNVWLSTSGGGIAWLHVRMDTRPKYYQFHDYKKS